MYSLERLLVFVGGLLHTALAYCVSPALSYLEDLPSPKTNVFGAVQSWQGSNPSQSPEQPTCDRDGVGPQVSTILPVILRSCFRCDPQLGDYRVSLNSTIFAWFHICSHAHTRQTRARSIIASSLLVVPLLPAPAAPLPG